MYSMGICARIAKRIITLLIVILGVVTLSFCLQIFTGTDPAEMLVRKTTLFATEDQIQAMRVELGLDGTLSEQYADYIKGLLTGDLGISITNRKPVIDNILLDEATASMDAESETMVQTALSALLKGRTVIVIAHRMRTIANADKIVVLDKGKVTEMGTPSELAKKGGLYEHLVALQQKQQMSSLPT